MSVSYLLLDLDGTLYPNNNGLWDEIAARMERFMAEVLYIPAAKIPTLRREYYQEYGTTLAGLRKHYDLNPEAFLDYVHEIDLAPFLSASPDLRHALTSIPSPKWVFTNSNTRHSRRVLQALGIEDLFDGIIDITTMDYHNKPSNQAYQIALRTIGSPTPANCLFVDDIPKNLAAAKTFGIHTVLIGSDGTSPGIDHQIPDISHLPGIIKQIEGGL